MRLNNICNAFFFIKKAREGDCKRESECKSYRCIYEKKKHNYMFMILLHVYYNNYDLKEEIFSSFFFILFSIVPFEIFKQFSQVNK